MKKIILSALLAFFAMPALADVSIVGSATNINSAGSCTAGSGSNRVVVIVLGAEPTATSSDLVVSALTYGTNSLANSQIIQAVTGVRTGSVARTRAAIYYIKEANILSGAQTVTVTYDQAISGTAKLTCFTLSGVNQTTPIENSLSNGNTVSSDPWTGSVTLANNSFAILEGVANSQVDPSAPDGAWTEDRDVYDGGATISVQHKDQTTGGSTTWTVDWSGASGGSLVIASFGEAVTPTFTSAPAVGTRTTSAIPINFTSDTTGTVYGVRCPDGQAAPTAAQVAAGNCTGNIAATQSWSEAVVATVADSHSFSSITDGTISDGSFVIDAGSSNYSTVAALADMSKIPAFSSNPAHSSTTSTTEVIAKTCDGPCTVSLVACPKDQTAPTVTEAEALKCTGNSSPLASATDDATGTMTLSGLTIPVIDAYAVMQYTFGTQHEAAVHSLTDLCLAAPSGKTVVNCPNGLTSIGAGGAIEALNAVITPDIAVGDIPIIDSATTPEGCQVTMSVAGVISIAGPGGSGSCSSARQYVNATFYDLSVGAIHADDLDWWMNNLTPIPPDPNTVVFSWQEGVAITPIDLTQYCPDPELDTVTVTQVSGLAAGMSIVGSVLSGTPTTRGITTLVLRCTDTPGATVDWQ